MNINHSVLSLIACCVLVFSAHCGNSPSGSGTTSRETASEHTAPQAAPVSAMAGAAAQQNEDQATPDPIAEREPEPETAAETEEAGMSVRRLVVAEGIEDREPQGAASRFSTDNDQLLAFVEAVNEGDEDGELVVTFESADGDEVGHITLNVPANSPRWRTWAFSRLIREPGSWTAIIRTVEGAELAREHFEIEG